MNFGHAEENVYLSDRTENLKACINCISMKAPDPSGSNLTLGARV